jgi:transposase
MITMSHQEIDRLAVIQQVDNRQLSQKEAASQLNLSVRQVKRIVKRFRDGGAAGLISKHRGKTANNRLPTKVKKKAIDLIRKTYVDFSPTFAHEKLTEQHGLSFSVETLRKWMIEGEIWQPKTARKARIHPSRPRRSCKGELIQIDGSPHRWFEERGEPCTLIVFIDDATSQLMALHFSPTETTQAYMETLSVYLHPIKVPEGLFFDQSLIWQ